MMLKRSFFEFLSFLFLFLYESSALISHFIFSTVPPHTLQAVRDKDFTFACLWISAIHHAVEPAFRDDSGIISKDSLPAVLSEGFVPVSDRA